jgi:DNA invertase Pin-like site-specific DNA recombinase
MKGQNIGYVRVSSVDQNTDRQLLDIHLDETFTEKASGKDINRPELKKCIKHLRAGDVLHIHSIDRLARSLKDLQKVVEDLTDKGVTVMFHKEGLSFESGSRSPINTLMFQMLGAFSQFERNLILERQKEGIAAAKLAGKVQFGAPRKIDSQKRSEIKERARQGEDKSKLSIEYGISRPTLYKILAE